MENNGNKSYESSLFLKYHKAIVNNILLLNNDGRLSSLFSFYGLIIIYKKTFFPN